MIKTSIEKIAKDIGMSDDKVQQDLLNGLGEAFGKYSDQNFHNQICHVSHGLTKEAEKFIT